MANNAISRTGTHTIYTSSGSSGVSGIWEYNKWEGTGSAGSSGITGTYHYSNDDLENGSIFSDIDSKISITFSQEVDNSSVKTFNKDFELPIDLRNQKGTIGLTHAVNGRESTASALDDNNLQALKLTSSPEVDFSTTSLQEFVEMSSTAETNDNINYVLTPKANLSSNTTYFLKIDSTNLTDASGASISYNTERGFVTDNTKSFVVTNDYYEGFSMQIENSPLLEWSGNDDDVKEVSPDPDNDSHPKFNSGDTMSLYREDFTTSGATALKILSIDGTKLLYQLEPSSYSMNVSYTATNPIVVTNINHNLIDDDKIQVYDIVSGNVVSTGEYTITKITSDTFSISVDGTGSDAGGLNYYRNVNKDDLLVWSEADSSLSATTYTIRKKVLSVPRKKDNNTWRNLLNNTFSTIKDSTSVSSTAKGKLIRANDSTISYIPVDDTGTLTTDVFVNNSIIDISTSTNDVRLHIKANTSPEHNVHPFHSSAPKVNSIFPKDGESFSRKLSITQITRKGAIALVSTNHPHNLSKDAFIKIIDSTQAVYNKTTKVLLVPSSNTFQYDMGSSSGFSGVQSPAPGKPKLQVSIDDGDNYAERYNSIFVNFSQSMNTSTITVANNTHLISADGTTPQVFVGGQDSASSTIQLSDDGFETIENCVSVVASAGNSVFAVVPEILKREHRYNIKAKRGIQDLGKTNSIYEFTTTEGVATGVVVRNPQTGEEIIYSKDEDPPKIKKTSLAGHVLESSTLSEITSPSDYQSLAINPGAITVQFSESMKINSVTTATSNTDPTGTVMMSCDDYSTVVQMTSTSPVVTTTDEDNDTFTFTPAANLSANAVYTLKILKDVTDDSPEENRMIRDNVSSIKVLVVNNGPTFTPPYSNFPSDHYTSGEIISGCRILTIKANTGTPTTGFTAGDTFLGLTSKGKGKVLDIITDSGAITSIRYTEIAGNDGSIRPLTPGEVCKVNSIVNFTIDNVAITDPPEGNVVSFTVAASAPPGTKLIYRDNKTDNDFETAHSSNSERIVGRTSNGYAFGHESPTYPIVGPGLKTATTGLVANVFFLSNGLWKTPNDQGNISEKTNLRVSFTQTMNVESINFNAVDTVVRDSYNILLSYDENFANTIPLSPQLTSSNNDSYFEFQPAILSNTNLQLTSQMNLWCKVAQTAKNKGGMNLASAWTTTYYAKTSAGGEDFKAIDASVFTTDGEEIKLGTGTSISMPNQSSIIARSTLIIIHFNEVPDMAEFAMYGGGMGEIELATASDFASGQYASTPTLIKQGKYGTEIHIILPVGLTASTQHYLRVQGSVGGSSEGGRAIDTTTQYFNSFTTSS